VNRLLSIALVTSVVLAAVHTGAPFAVGNGKSSAASSTAACDGERVYIRHTKPHPRCFSC
jgi:hypothetical protein